MSKSLPFTFSIRSFSRRPTLRSRNSVGVPSPRSVPTLSPSRASPRARTFRGPPVPVSTASTACFTVRVEAPSSQGVSQKAAMGSPP